MTIDRPPLSMAFHFLLWGVGRGGNSRGRALSAARHLSAYQAGRGRAGEAIPASKTARIPVRKMPSKVPAPPIEAIGAPRPLILSRLERSAPISVPIEPPIYASGAAYSRDSRKARIAVATTGANTGTAMPSPCTGVAIE